MKFLGRCKGCFSASTLRGVSELMSATCVSILKDNELRLQNFPSVTFLGLWYLKFNLSLCNMNVKCHYLFFSNFLQIVSSCFTLI
ncbi:acylphosphatase 1 [Rhinolophus ferrumequinum]|uniref:Acylphosphatase 1 n=1 Tax=Rhinolophus ferrumequinum TaxID=59479 RepID=A0A7J7XLW7_RHIFE|nr:acylphosphatase 1 [Rhinolophus ferrumequinum]